MDKNKIQQLIIMMPIILIAGIFGYFKYLLSPLSEKSKALNLELEQIKKDYKDSEARAARLPKLEQEITVLNNEIKEIEKRLPPGADVPNLIRLLSKKMETYQIIWNRLAPGTQSSKEHYIEHFYTIPFTCSYHNLALFLTEVGQMERIFASRFNKLSYNAGRVSGDLIFLIYTSKT